MPDTTHDRVKELTRQLETGIQDLYASGRYGEYLAMLSKFHKYSYGNVMLIFMQCPHASMVAGFQTWKKEFQRNVKKGERGIRVLAPCPVRRKLENPSDETEAVYIPYFKQVTVFDISQTEGKELPAQIVTELAGNVDEYENLFNRLVEYSDLPVTFEQLPDGYKGSFYRGEQRIALAPGMSQSQTIKTLVHEIAHSKLHNDGEERDRSAKEVEAESVAYVVCSHLGLLIWLCGRMEQKQGSAGAESLPGSDTRHRRRDDRCRCPTKGTTEKRTQKSLHTIRRKQDEHDKRSHDPYAGG